MIKIIQTLLIILCFDVCVGQTIFFDSYFKNLKSDTIFSDNKKITFIKAKNGEDSIKYFNRYFPNGQMAFKQIEITDSEYNMFLYRWRLEYFENGQLKLDSLVDERKNNNILNFTTEYYKNGIKK